MRDVLYMILDFWVFIEILYYVYIRAGYS